MDEAERLLAEIEHWESIGDYCWALVLMRGKADQERLDYIRGRVEAHFDAIKKLRGEA